LVGDLLHLLLRPFHNYPCRRVELCGLTLLIETDFFRTNAGTTRVAEKLFSKPQCSQFQELVALWEFERVGPNESILGWLAAVMKNPTICIVGSASI
jgi:hypothetical protein